MNYTFSSQSTSGRSHKFDRVSCKKTDSLSLRLDMVSEEVVLSNPVEQVFVHFNDLTHEVLDVDYLELTAR